MTLKQKKLIIFTAMTTLEKLPLFYVFLWVLLNRAPTSTQLYPPPPSSFKPPPSSLQHPQRYNNLNVAPNWAISPNLHRKFKVVRFA